MDANQLNLYLQRAIQQHGAQFNEQLKHLSASSRVHEKRAQQLEQQVRDLSSALNAVQVTSGSNMLPRSGDTTFIDEIPGKREPYILLVDILISANSPNKVSVPASIGQEGPFVATRRFATFQSAYEFTSTDPDTSVIGRFVGRSYGRYRPVHSASDSNDSQHNAHSDTAFWYLTHLLTLAIPDGTRLPSATLGMPSNMSSFRTMEFDGRVTVYAQGSGRGRQNISVPTSMWSAGNNSPIDLAALDFFERGDAIVFEVQPNHVNNPPAGNVSAPSVLPAVGGLIAPAGWPFVEGQFDAHEGIASLGASTANVDGDTRLPNLLATDPVSRLPNGILTIGFEGYRILQPLGA
jgi:hypothetical protein